MNDTDFKQVIYRAQGTIDDLLEEQLVAYKKLYPKDSLVCIPSKVPGLKGAIYDISVTGGSIWAQIKSIKDGKKMYWVLAKNLKN